MKLISYNIQDKSVYLKYETTWNNTWRDCLDFMQVFYTDIKNNVERSEYTECAGALPKPLSDITEDSLYNSHALSKEGFGIYLAGTSKALNLPIGITIYNNLRTIVVVVLFREPSVAYAFASNIRSLDGYLDSIEIEGRCINAARSHIHLFRDYLYATNFSTKSWKELNADQKKLVCYFSTACKKYNAKPFRKDKQHD